MSILSLSNISFKPYFGEPKTIKIGCIDIPAIFQLIRKMDSILKYSEFFEVRIIFEFFISFQNVI